MRKLAAAFCVAVLAAGVAAQSAPPAPPAPPGSRAAEKGGAQVTLSTERNVYRAGGQVRPDGRVDGDFFAAAGRVVLDQPVSDDALLAGGSVEVRAEVGEDLRVAGGDISVEAPVGGELFAAGGQVTVTRAGSIGRGATVFGAHLTFDGRIDGGLIATGEKVMINNEVTGNVTVTAEHVELGPLARIGGKLTYVSGNELKKAEGATIAGGVTREEGFGKRRRGEAPQEEGRRWKSAWIAGGLFGFVSLLAFAAVLRLLVPVFTHVAPGRIKAAPWVALGIGFASLVAVPVLAVLMMVTVLGIPIGIALLALYPVLLLVGFVVGVFFVAREIPATFRRAPADSYWPAMGWFAVALFVVLLVGAAPWVGWIALLLVSFAGVGGSVLELYRRRQKAPVPA